MSYEPEQQNQDGAGASDGAEGGEDLQSALGGGEMNFVTETKQPMNKGTLIVVGLLIACGAATYFMYVRSGPAEAVAAGDPNAEKTIGQFLDGSQKNVEQMRKMLQDTEKVVQQFRTQANETQVPLAQLAVNPFMKEKPKPSEDNAAAEKEAQRLATVTKVTEAAGDLRLQTIIHRDPKKATCMINNTLYRKGQKITVGDSKIVFTVDEIRPDGVTVSSPVQDQPVKFELKMKQL
jgi:hypothetical protein